MQSDENQQDREARERLEQESNKAASENMAENDAEQNLKYRANQNHITKSTDTASDSAALSNNHEAPPGNDSLSLEEKNKARLKEEQDQDFGNEQLQ